VLGTVTAYVAAIAYSWDSRLDGLSELSSVPTTNLLIILIGMPLIAVAGGWLLAGREPPGVAHQRAFETDTAIMGASAHLLAAVRVGQARPRQPSRAHKRVGPVRRAGR
jgi:ABC-type Fe3+ transport system permease subunit